MGQNNSSLMDDISPIEKKNKKISFKINDILEKNKQLEEENKQLEEENKQLKKIATLKNEINKIDKNMIKLTVKKMLENPNVNTGILPDAIEGKLYENMISFLLGLLKESLDTTKIEFLGHEINISLRKLDHN